MHHFMVSYYLVFALVHIGPLPPRILTLWWRAHERKRANGNNYAPPRASRELAVHVFAPMLKSGGKGGHMYDAHRHSVCLELGWCIIFSVARQICWSRQEPKGLLSNDSTS